MKNKTILCILVLSLFNSLALAENEPQSSERLGVVGDSLASAGFANPELYLELSQVARLLLRFNLPIFSEERLETKPKMQLYFDPEAFNIEEPIPLATRYYNNYDHVTGETVEDPSLIKKDMIVAEVEEYSFGYMVGSALGVKAKNIHFASQGGAKVASLSNQFQRLLTENSELPERVVVSYNANDMCYTQVTEDDPKEIAQRYYDRLSSQLSLSMSTLPSNGKKTSIYLLASANVIDILKNPSVLTKVVSYRGTPTFCYEIRTKKLLDAQLGSKKGVKEIPARDSFIDKELITNALPGMCRGIFNVSPRDTDKIQHLQQVYAELLAAQEQVVFDLQQLALQNNFKLYYIKDTADITFNAADIASDCFHPSIRGQEKFAKATLGAIKKIEQIPKENHE